MDRQQLETILKYGLAAIVVGIGGFAGLFLVKSIAALAVTVVGVLVLYHLTPVLAHTLAQLKIMGHMALARANPIPDLWLLYQKKADALAAGADAITAFNLQVKDYGDKLQAFKARRPERALEFQTTHDNMLRVLGMRTDKLRLARDKLAEFKQVIAEAQEVWEMTQAAIKANKAMKNFDGIDPIDEIRQKTALDAVSSSLNQVMAELETSLSLDYQAMTTLAASSLSPLPLSIEASQAGGKENAHVPLRR